MKLKTKILFSLLLVFITFFILGATNVKATDYEENLIKRIAPDGKNITLKTVKPTNEFEAEFYLTGIANKLLNEENYRVYASPTDDTYTHFVVTIVDENEQGFQKKYNVNVTYDEPKENKNVTDTINAFISKLKNFDESGESYYHITDLSLINYYMTSEKSELWRAGSSGRALKYSNELINASNGSDISFYLDIRAGSQSEDLMYEFGFGDMTIYYKDYNYASKKQGIYLKRVIYIPQDTPDTKEAYISAAQKRINDYLGTDDVKVTYGGLLDSLEEYCEDEFIPRDITDGNYYNITIKGRTYKFYILKGTEQQLKKPTYLGKHIETNVKITTEESTVPLDTHLTVENVKNDNIKQILGTENYQAFDIKLFSDGKNDWITKLENGKFLVSIPVEELNGKTITTYYINKNNEIEEHKTVVKDKIASFETDHFSTYILAEKTENKENLEQENNQTTEQEQSKEKEKHILDDEPKTGVINIVTYLTLFLIVSIVGIIVCKRKMYR